MLMCEIKGSMGIGTCNLGKVVILEYLYLRYLIFFCEVGDNDI